MPDDSTPSHPSLHGVRVAQLIECDGPGGAERVVVHLTTALVERGARVVAFLPRGREGWLGTQLLALPVEIQPFDLRQALRPGFFGWVTERLRHHRADLVHSHEFTFAVHGAWSAWRLGIGHVTTMHGGRYWAGRPRRRLLMRGAVALGGELVAVSDVLRDHLAEDLHLSPARVTLVPNGVPCTGGGVRERVRAELALGDEARLAVAIGNLYPVKGHAVLLDALALLRERYPTLHVAIAGRGGEEGALRQRAAERGVADRVHLLGLRSDVPDLLAAADLFVMPSLSEGLPMALLEALCAGVPVVASAVGAIPVVLEQGRGGALAAAGDAASLADAVGGALADPAATAARARHGQAHARATFSLEHMVDRYVELYARAASRRAGGAPALRR